jgi:hypothetical protein
MYVIKQVIFAYVYERRLEERKNKLLVSSAFVAAFMVLGVVLDRIMLARPEGLGIPETPYLITLSTSLTCSFYYVLITLWIYASRHVALGEAAYAAALGYISEHISYCLENIVTELMPSKPSVTGNYLFDLAVTLVFALLFDIFFAKKMTKDGHYIAQSAEIGILIVTIIVLVMVLSSMASEGGYVPLHSVYSLIFGMFILVAQLERQQALQKEREAGIREQLLISAQAQYRTYQENSELLRRKAHDLKHQMAALRMLHDGEEGQKVINSIAESVRIYDSYVRTGNEQLDTILTQKNQICVENDILMTCIVNGKLLSFMEPVDLFTLFGNMLDNAIEAVKDLPKEKRSISLEVSEKLGMLRIREENPYTDLDVKDGKLITTKSDKESHGFGVRSMELVAQKYEGVLSYEMENGVFVLTIMFYLTN